MSYYDMSEGPSLNGKVYNGRGSVAPYEFLANAKMPATPVSQTALVWTLNASVTSPVPIFLGKEFAYTKTALNYTFAAADNAILNSSGVETTGALATDVWYMYLYINTSDDLTLIASQTAPAKSDHRFNATVYSHAGTSSVTEYQYVGCTTCTNSSSPAFVPFTKVGFDQLFTEAAKFEQVTTDTSYAALAFTGVEGLPTHEGVRASGWLETAAGDTVKLAYDASGSGAILATGATGDVGTAPFTRFPLNSGDMFALHGTAAGDVHVTSFEDVV